jgi:hypothetical protein
VEKPRCNFWSSISFRIFFFLIIIMQCHECCNTDNGPSQIIDMYRKLRIICSHEAVGFHGKSKDALKELEIYHFIFFLILEK